MDPASSLADRPPASGPASRRAAIARARRVPPESWRLRGGRGSVSQPWPSHARRDWSRAAVPRTWPVRRPMCRWARTWRPPPTQWRWRRLPSGWPMCAPRRSSGPTRRMRGTSRWTPVATAGCSPGSAAPSSSTTPMSARGCGPRGRGLRAAALHRCGIVHLHPGTWRPACHGLARRPTAGERRQGRGQGADRHRLPSDLTRWGPSRSGGDQSQLNGLDPKADSSRTSPSRQASSAMSGIWMRRHIATISSEGTMPSSWSTAVRTRPPEQTTSVAPGVRSAVIWRSFVRKRPAAASAVSQHGAADRPGSPKNRQTASWNSPPSNQPSEWLSRIAGASRTSLFVARASGPKLSAIFGSSPATRVAGPGTSLARAAACRAPAPRDPKTPVASGDPRRTRRGERERSEPSPDEACRILGRIALA